MSAARVYGGKREAKAPFVFRISDDEGAPVFTVPEPDAGTVMDIEEATTSRRVLKLFLGEQFPALMDAIEAEAPEVLVELARDISRHFGLFDGQSNRAERRRRERVR